jgi:hypothetical protein
MSSRDSQLVEAYELIKAGQRTQAGQLLRDYLSAQPNDPNGWWLMAHAVSKPEAMQKCLEKVLELDPGHTKARDKLARVQAQLAPAVDFVMPDDMTPHDVPPNHERFDWGNLMAGRVSSGLPARTSSGNDIWSPPSRDLELPEPSKLPARTTTWQPPKGHKDHTNTYIGLGLLVVAIVVLAGLLAYKAAGEGWIGRTDQTVAGTISTDSYTVKFPTTWLSECSSGFLWMQEVCAFTTDEKYSLLDLYTTGRGDVGSDSLLESVDYIFFKGGRERPDLVVTGVLMDYPQSGGDYQYIHDSILYYEELYKAWLGRTNYIRGYDLYMRYEKQNPEIWGETSYVYWISGKDAIGVLMTGRGYFLICDAFVPHGDRMWMLEVVAYSTTSLESIPRRDIENLINTIVFQE